MVFVLYVLLSCVAPARVTGQSQEITRKKTNRRFKKDIDKTKHQTKLRIHNKDTRGTYIQASALGLALILNLKIQGREKLTNINLPI